MGFSDYLGRFWYSSEPMFGVIMVVCFTSVLRAFPNASDQIVGTILLSALFCCIAWGLVDGIFIRRCRDIAAARGGSPRGYPRGFP
jgi:hypothetical protein